MLHEEDAANIYEVETSRGLKMTYYGRFTAGSYNSSRSVDETSELDST